MQNPQWETERRLCLLLVPLSRLHYPTGYAKHLCEDGRLPSRAPARWLWARKWHQSPTRSGGPASAARVPVAVEAWWRQVASAIPQLALPLRNALGVRSMVSRRTAEQDARVGGCKRAFHGNCGIPGCQREGTGGGGDCCPVRKVGCTSILLARHGARGDHFQGTEHGATDPCQHVGREGRAVHGECLVQAGDVLLQPLGRAVHLIAALAVDYTLLG